MPNTPVSRADSPAIILATRSPHKLAEIRAILTSSTVLSLADVGIEPAPAEDGIEAFGTFYENALAKARHFALLTARPTLADDSGIALPALHGAPGVHSKRFSGRSDLTGQALDDANNQALLERIATLPPRDRVAYYLCATALVLPSGRVLATFGACRGAILHAPVGDGGFGYDPLFLDPDTGRSFAQLDPHEKNRKSHRGRALRATASLLSKALTPL